MAMQAAVGPTVKNFRPNPLRGFGIRHISLLLHPFTIEPGIVLMMQRLLTSCLVLSTCLMASVGLSATIDEALSKPGRLEADIARDEHSKPSAILPLLKLQPGDLVVDIFAGGGYYSELLAGIVGPDGEVLLHNNRGFRAWGVNLLEDRFNGRTFANITLHDREIADLDLGANTLDAAILVMAYHDMYVVPSRYNGEKYVPDRASGGRCAFCRADLSRLETRCPLRGRRSCGRAGRCWPSS